MKDGLLLIDKEPGFTSHDVVQKVRRLLKQKKIGHCGTLDPDATGLLLLTLGTATRLTRFLIRAPKVYVGEIRFGIATDTYDSSGRVVHEATAGELAALTREQVAAAMQRFSGAIEQMAPPYSAKKINGVKYYELARRGEEVPAGSFQVSAAAGVGRLEELLGGGEGAGEAWVPFDRIPLPFGEVTTDPQQENRISHGQTVLVRELAAEEGDWVKLVNRRREFIAIGTVVERIGSGGVGLVQPKVVFR